MTHNITIEDLYNYYELRSMLTDLNRKIYNGRKTVITGSTDVFNARFEILFPKYENIGTAYTTGDKITTTTSTGETTAYYDSIYSLKKLLHNSLYPHLNQTQKDPSYNEKIINEHIKTGVSTKDHLCFIRFDQAAGSALYIEPDKPVINNILYSICLIDIFIKIIEALKDCYKNYSNLFESFTDSTKIYIVEKKLKSYHDTTTPKGLFLDTSNTVSGSDRPLPAIYLYIGDLSNIFHSDDIISVLSNITFTSASSDESIATYIFKNTNQLNNNSTTVPHYFFNCLKLYTDEAQTAVSSNAGATSELDKNYENNIYLIRIFLEMIKNIKGGTDFNTTINYLYIYILCLKSTLLSSIRAANIFYNNKHGLNAIAISYDDIFSPGVATAGGASCSALDIRGFVNVKSLITFSSAASCTTTKCISIYYIENIRDR